MAKMFNENNQDTNLISFVIKEVCIHDKITASISSSYVHGYKSQLNNNENKFTQRCKTK